MALTEVIAKNLLNGIGSLTSGLFHDVIISVEKRQFECHRIVLCAYSDYFFAMFTSGMKEDITQTVKLEGVSHQLFATILEILYNGTDSVDATNVTDIWHVASMYQISCLHQYCVKYMLREDIISSENCIRIWLEARLTSCESIADKAMDFINQNLATIKTTKDFLSCDLEDVSYIIQSDDLNVSSEDEIVDTIVRWVKYNERRRRHLTKILSMARLNLVSEIYIVERLLTEKIILEKPQALELVRRSLRYHVNKARRHDECTEASVCRLTSSSNNVMVMFGKEANEIQAVSFQTELCSNLSPLPYDTGRGTSACTFGDDIFVAGGETWLNSLFRYKAKKDRWIELAPMNKGRYDHVTAAVGECLYVLGGQTPQGETLVCVECFEISNDEWCEIGFLHTAIHSCGSVVLDSRIILCGGVDVDDKITDIVQCFDTSSKTSYILGNLPYETKIPRSFIGPKETVYFTSQEGSVWRMELVFESVNFHEIVKLWDQGSVVKHEALLHDDVLYIIHTDDQLPLGIQLKTRMDMNIHGACCAVKNIRIRNFEDILAFVRTSLPEQILKKSQTQERITI